ncbi:MAG: type 4a pilus biogenesis protein PilO [Clostridia bacterium]|nr:type 4a pilus biogenesis protein PilO [Clostridia bacterium]MDH7572640.1 type 4a pilus biogenesis protein PilO [Clostridia bacterium]
MSRTAREKQLLLLLCLVLGAVTFYRLGAGVAWPRYLQLRESVAGERQALVRAQYQAQRLPELKQETARAEAALAEVRRPFQTVGQAGPLNCVLGLLPAGLEVRELVPGAEVDQGFYRVYPLRLKVAGPYEEVEAFLERVEELPIYVRDLRMSLAEEGAGIEAELDLDVFFQALASPALREVPGAVQRNPFEPLSAVTLPGTPPAASGTVKEGPASGIGVGTAAGAASPEKTLGGRTQKQEAQPDSESKPVNVWPEAPTPNASHQYTFPVRR